MVTLSSSTCPVKIVRIRGVTQGEQLERVRKAVSQRAFQISQARRVPGSPNDDWRQAESEICGGLTCGLLFLDDQIRLNTDLGRMRNGKIEIYVEPRRLTIFSTQSPASGNQSAALPREVVRSVALPEVIDTARVTARVKGQTLEIDLPKKGVQQRLRAADTA